MRRSLRLSNRRSSTIQECLPSGRVVSESLPNLHIMGGSSDPDHVSLGNHALADINLNVIDFIPVNQDNFLFDIDDGAPQHVPNERGDGLLNNPEFLRRETRSTRFTYSAFKVSELIMAIALTIIIALICEMYFSSSKRSQEAFTKDSYYKLKYKTDRLVKIKGRISYLTKKLSYLNKTMEETIKWRDMMMTEVEKMKETIQLSSEQLDKIYLKIEEALTLYDADKIALIDYALESAGGYVTSTPDTIPIPSRFTYDIMGFVIFQNPSNPQLLIQPGTLPGQCFAFKGSRGRIRIRLARRVEITAVTLEHVYPNLVPDMSSAPKDFKVYGLGGEDGEFRFDLGEFGYKLNRKALQIFYVVGSNKTSSYDHVELEVLTNHGNPNYTCVYRFRVHGNKPCEDKNIL